MRLSEVFTAENIALNWTTAANNSIPYLGSGFFPAKKKAGLDLKWLKGEGGLPVSLAPSNFDAKSTFRDRIGISKMETEMPFFRESMLVKESDRQEILRVQDSNDPYAATVLQNIFNDAQTLIDGANVVPERMIMQLLSPVGGSVAINILANNVNYAYNYDPDGNWKAKHYLELQGTSKWSDSGNCDPVKDIEDALDAQEAESGNRPVYALMSKKTFNYIKDSAKVRSGVLAQNITATINYTSARIKSYIQEVLGITLIIYTKKYKNEAGETVNFFPDDIVTLLPEGALGNCWYGTTPEEIDLISDQNTNVSIVNTGVAVTVTQTSDPVNTKTTVSEIVLPSFERLNECYAIDVN